MTTQSIRVTRTTRLLAACAAMVLLAGMASAAIINVPGDYVTIQLAVNNAVAGVDEIHVAAGTYTEGAVLTVNKSVKIYGPNKDIDPNTDVRLPEAIIQTTGGANTYNVNFTTGISNVELNGFTLDGRLQNGGINYTKTTNLTISYNRIIDVNNAGINSGGAAAGLPANTLITHNYIYNVMGLNKTGIMITGGAYEAGHGLWTASYNVIDRINYAGFQPQGGIKTRIIGNLIQNVTRHGINFYSERDIQVIGNIFRNVNIRANDCDTGAIRFYAPAAGTGSCYGPFIIQNNLIDGCNNGIHIRSCSSSLPYPPACGTAACTEVLVHSDYPTSPIIIQDNNIINFRGYAFNYSLPAAGAPPIATVIDGNFIDPGTIDGQYGGADTNPNDTVSTPVIANDQSSSLDFNADTDGDGLKNWEETDIYGTNPNVADTDTGGVADGIEVDRGTDPNNPADDGTLVPPADNTDFDGDGYSNAYEYQVGTDPTSASSKPILGDVNNNNVIDNVDAAIVQNISLDNIPAANYQQQRLDVNGDGKVDVIDAALLFDFFLDNIAILR